MTLVQTGDVMRRCGVTRRIIEHLLETRPELEPKVRRSGRRMFAPEEVAAVARALRERVQVARQPQAAARRRRVG